MIVFFEVVMSSLFQLSFEIFYRFSVILLALVTVISNKSWRHLFEFSPHYRRFTSQARRTRESPVEERRKIKLYVFFSPGLPLRAKCLVRLAWLSLIQICHFYLMHVWAHCNWKSRMPWYLLMCVESTRPYLWSARWVSVAYTHAELHDNKLYSPTLRPCSHYTG